MKTVAIICEYNPFHNGHKIQIEEIREKYSNNGDNTDVCIISLMSGNFVQRGEPAILPKYERAMAAADCGSDLVLELPFPFCCSPAENFARGAVSILDSLGGIDYLCFGSESAGALKAIEVSGSKQPQNAVDKLSEFARNLISDEFEAALSERIKNDRSRPFPTVRADAYYNLFGEPLPTSPNDILGVEYIKELMLSQSPILPVAFGRKPGFSATESRKALREGNFGEIGRLLPAESAKIFLSGSENSDSRENFPQGGVISPAVNSLRAESPYADIRRIESHILAFFRTAGADKLAGFEGVSDPYIFINAAKNARSIDEFFELCANKLYTSARIRRTVLNCICGVKKNYFDLSPLYTTVLAANKSGREYLRGITKTARIQVITKPAHFSLLENNAKEQFLLAVRAFDIYSLCLPFDRKNESEIRSTPYIVV